MTDPRITTASDMLFIKCRALRAAKEIGTAEDVARLEADVEQARHKLADLTAPFTLTN